MCNVFVAPAKSHKLRNVGHEKQDMIWIPDNKQASESKLNRSHSQQNHETR